MMPAKKPEAQPSKEDQAGPSIALLIAKSAVEKKASQAEKDPEKKWEDLGAELYDAIEKKDRKVFGTLFAKQVKIAVAEALRVRDKR